jgi:hypothetical protein
LASSIEETDPNQMRKYCEQTIFAEHRDHVPSRLNVPCSLPLSAAAKSGCLATGADANAAHSPPVNTTNCSDYHAAEGRRRNDYAVVVF